MQCKICVIDWFSNDYKLHFAALCKCSVKFRAKKFGDSLVFIVFLQQQVLRIKKSTL